MTDLVDKGNTLLTEQPSQLTTGLVDTPGGQRLIVTIRTPSSTVSVLLNAKDADTWAQNMTGSAARMSKTGLIVATGSVASPPPSPNGHKQRPSPN